MIGALFAGPVSDRYGRRMGMFVGGEQTTFELVQVSSTDLVAGRSIHRDWNGHRVLRQLDPAVGRWAVSQA